MSETDKFSESEFPAPLSPQAVIVEGVTQNGKPCRLIDNTGTIPSLELKKLLQELIDRKEFGIKGLSGADGTIQVGALRGTHIQIGESLFRLLLSPYEARIEKF